MNEKSICNCCYNTDNLIKKCKFEHHQICNNCSNKYILRFGRKNCMFCDPYEEKHISYNNTRSIRRLSDNEIYFILFCNLFLTIALFAFIFLMLTFIIKIVGIFNDILSNGDFFKIYYIGYCINIESDHLYELLYCNF